MIANHRRFTRYTASPHLARNAILTCSERNENIRTSQHGQPPMPEASAPNPQSDAEQLDAAADQAIAACGGDAREAVKALIVANEFLETEIEASVSRGYLLAV